VFFTSLSQFLLDWGIGLVVFGADLLGYFETLFFLIKVFVYPTICLTASLSLYSQCGYGEI
jgi:hypothetical protein